MDTAIAALRYIGALVPRSAGAPDLQDRIVAFVMKRRRHWISPTTTVGKLVIRVMIGYLTCWQHLEKPIGALREGARAER